MIDPQPLQDSLAQALARFEVHLGAGPVVAAVSGGRDSCALVGLLDDLRRAGRLPFGVVLAHVDHGIHPDSPRAANHVAALAARLDWPHAQTRLDGIPPREEALRDARYDALIRIATNHRATAILTAHHADDDLETVLFRMLRGTGPRGLAGIPGFRPLQPGLALVRPLLGVRAADLHAYLAQRGDAFIADPTNDDRRYARNRIRHDWIPALRGTVDEDLDGSLLRLAEQAREITDIVTGRAHRILREAVRFETPWRAVLDLRRRPALVTPADAVFLREALHLIHSRLDPRQRRARHGWTERAEALIGQPDGRRLQGPVGILVERTRDGLLFVNQEGDLGSPPPEAVLFSGETPQRFGTTEWALAATDHGEPPLDPPPGPPPETRRAMAPDGPRVVSRAILDVRGAPRPWQLRSRRSGDRFLPLGAVRSVELRRFMQNRHLPRFDRDRLPLLVDAEDRILWVPGVEIAHPNRVRFDTTACTALELLIVGGGSGQETPYCSSPLKRNS